MSINEVEEAIRSFSPEEQEQFRAWYAEFDSEKWDRQLEQDVAKGRLDWLVKEALKDQQSGRCTDR